MKILIAEDNKPMREMIKVIMTDPLNILFECDDGGSAVVLYDQVHPDCVLMDVEMKPVDGITATKQIRESHPEAKIVIVTNFGDSRTREAARAAGAQGFVVKENLMELRKIVQAIQSSRV